MAPRSILLCSVLIAGCATETSLSSPPPEADHVLAAACTVTDVWHDAGDAPALEEQRGYNVDGQPIWHAVDGVITNSWGYDDAGRAILRTLYDGDGEIAEEHTFIWSDDGKLEVASFGRARRVDVEYVAGRFKRLSAPRPTASL